MISKKRLIKEQQNTGYRQEIIEKVVWLIHALNNIAEDRFLKDRLALKGGTALNLFYFPLPRLSVDADLNYIGAIQKEIMLNERSEIQDRICKIFQRMGLNLLRNPQVHAGGKMIWKYNSALGNKGTIELDLNFMYRIPLFPATLKNSVELAGQQVIQFQVLDLHELAAGKLSALIDRGAGRDIFDVYHLFQYQSLDVKKLRLCFVIYSAMNCRKNIININIKDIAANKNDFQNKLIPVLNNDFKKTFKSADAFSEHLFQSVQINFSQLLPFNNQERLFIETIHKGGEIQPELITDDKILQKKIIFHPALLWANRKSK